MSEWIELPLEKLADISSGGTPSRSNPQFWGGDIPWVTPSDITACKTNYLFDVRDSITEKGLAASSAKPLPEGALLLTSRASIGELRIAARPLTTNQGFKNVVANDLVDSDFLFYQLSRLKGEFLRYAAGSTFLEINRKDTGRVAVPHPQSKREQRKIARILQTIDQAIEKTEALIEKYQQIKVGLMHDLFTRGIGPDGQLRPPREEAPELYHETPIGWIPKEWCVSTVANVLEAVVDGPFGSNLKTEHYVEDPGVRVVRLQNVLEYEYNDSDRAYVSEKHAAMLLRNKVVSEDVLIAGLGEERYPVGRACLYPEGLPSAINKADCFRARCVPDVAMNKFFMLFLNSMLARRQVRRHEQGVTRPRINTGNLKRLQAALPSVNEQKSICSQFDCIQQLVDIEKKRLDKLNEQKAGLMHDLLTGKVPVRVDTVAEPETAHA